MQTALENPGIVSLAAGFVDQQSLPVEIAGQAVVRAAGRPDRGAAGAPVRDDHRRPRAARPADRRAGTGRGSPGGVLSGGRIPRTVVTTGSAQLIYLVCEALLDPGDIVLVESPTYFVFLGPVGDPRGAGDPGPDRRGGASGSMSWRRRSERLEAEGQLDRVKLIYTIPEHANPTGISLAADRRGPLVELARRWSKTQRIFVLEDAAYRGLSFGAGEPPSVWSHDREGGDGDPGPDVQQDLQPGVEDRLRRLTREA